MEFKLEIMKKPTFIYCLHKKQEQIINSTYFLDSCVLASALKLGMESKSNVSVYAHGNDNGK